MEEQSVPFVLRFKKHILIDAVDPFDETGVTFDATRGFWINAAGEPLFASRANKPYTSVWTAPHMINGGYTPKGGYKPPRLAPGKMDRRAGK